MKFVKMNSPQNIVVEQQNLKVQFAHVDLVDGVWTNRSYFSECRDFMGDVLYATEKQNPIEIYGFRYCPKTNPINKKQCKIAMEFPSEETKNLFLNNLTMLEKFSIDFIPKKVYHETTLPFVVLIFDNFWNKTIFGMSFLTFILKCLCYEVNQEENLLDQIREKVYLYKDEWNNKEEFISIKEANYLKNLDKKEIKKLPKTIKNVILKMNNCHGHINHIENDTHTVHNRSGFFYCLRWKTNEPYILFKKELNATL